MEYTAKRQRSYIFTNKRGQTERKTPGLAESLIAYSYRNGRENYIDEGTKANLCLKKPNACVQRTRATNDAPVQ
jgi:hypothetical protein